VKDVEPKMNYVGESRMADKPKCLAGNSLREKAKRTDTIRGRIMSVSVGSLGRIFESLEFFRNRLPFLPNFCQESAVPCECVFNHRHSP